MQLFAKSRLLAGAPVANGSSFGTLYHGTAKPFKTFSQDKSYAASQYGVGAYLTEDKTGYARFFARVACSNHDETMFEDGYVLTVKVKSEAKILDLRKSDADKKAKTMWKQAVTDYHLGPKLREYVMSLGYDGIAYTEPFFPEGNVVKPNALTVVVYNTPLAVIEKAESFTNIKRPTFEEYGYK